MKLTIATGIYPPEIGGPATFLREMVPIFKKHGWTVDVVTYGAPRSGVTAVSRDNPFRFIAFLRAVLRSARHTDLIFTTDTFSAGFPAALASWWLNKPLVARFVGDSAWEISRSNGWIDDPFEEFQKKKYSFKIELLRRIQRWVLKRSNIITVSEFLRGVLRKWGMKNISVVYNAIDPIKLPARDVLRKKLGFDRKFVALNVGRITKYKGVDKIISMCSRLRKEIPELLLVVVGDGPALDEAKHAAERELITHLVQFVGRKDEHETRTFMKASDVLVLNSEYEGMSHTLLEAMSVECPVVASAVCGNPELVKGRGLLFKYNDMGELKDQIVKLYRESELRKRLVRKALHDLPSRDKQEKAVLEVLNNARAHD
jgi:glycosyltransferase involved in cell wall biosynthesis